MKHFALIILFASSLSGASVKVTPSSVRLAPAVQGTVLMIKAKHPLKISKQQQQALDQELGESARNQLYMAMVMEKSIFEITSQFHAANRPITKQIIEKYKSILFGHTKVSLNF